MASCVRESFVVAYLLFNWIRNFDECLASILNSIADAAGAAAASVASFAVVYSADTEPNKVWCDSAVCDGMIVIFYYLIWVDKRWVGYVKLWQTSQTNNNDNNPEWILIFITVSIPFAFAFASILSICAIHSPICCIISVHSLSSSFLWRLMIESTGLASTTQT